MALYRDGDTVAAATAITRVDESAVDLNGGSIDGIIIGANTAAAGTFTALNSTSITDNGDAATIVINSDETISVELKDYSETVYTNLTATGAVSVDVDNGPVQEMTLTGNVVFTFTNPVADGATSNLTLLLTQDGTGSRTITWPGSVKWASGTAPTLTTTAAAVSICTFFTPDGGTVWYGFLSGDNFS